MFVMKYTTTTTTTTAAAAAINSWSNYKEDKAPFTQCRYDLKMEQNHYGSTPVHMMPA